MQYLDFEIHIAPGTAQEYVVVLKSPAGDKRAVGLFGAFGDSRHATSPLSSPAISPSSLAISASISTSGRGGL